MSLINKMLQDLDARTNAGSEAADLYTKPVARKDGRLSVPVLAAAAVAVVAVSAGGALAWRHLHKPAPAQVAVAKPAPVIMLGPQPAPAPAPAPQAAAAVASAPAADVPDAPPTKHEAPAAGDAQPKAAVAPGKRAEPRPAKAEREQLRLETMAGIKAESAPPLRKAKATVAEGKEETAAQKAETAYRKALASLQDGWVSDAIASLEQALQANPKHEAARQTIVSLLMENKRYDEAMRQLQAGLSADPRQPALAMLLARLQIERGGSGIDTLTRTLPYASGNGEYHAFLAGALQRQGRNSEAASQYQAALRSAPQNGVWWMGLGICLQADKRDSEALEAFRRARANGLSPELQSFVDRKIQQLAH